MEIDCFSTPSVRSVGRKRARSPTSPSSLDRPLKRASGSAGRTPSPFDGRQRPPQANTDLHNLPSAFLECRTSDDWVVKTGGLKLDSPSFGLGHVPLPDSERWNVDSTAENTVDDAHEVMMTDDDPTTAMEAWPFPSTGGNGSSPFVVSTLTHASFHSCPPLAAHQAAPPSPRSDIHIHIQPATQSNRSLAHPSINPPSPLSTSTSDSGAWSSPTTSARTPRVTMGPRPDCEKCRMGVKGHWMHVD